MKVTVKQKPEEFKPVTLEITLESMEELAMLKSVSGMNLSIPNLFDSRDYKNLFYAFLKNLHNTLHQL